MFTNFNEIVDNLSAGYPAIKGILSSFPSAIMDFFFYVVALFMALAIIKFILSCI